MANCWTHQDTKEFLASLKNQYEQNNANLKGQEHDLQQRISAMESMMTSSQTCCCRAASSTISTSESQSQSFIADDAMTIPKVFTNREIVQKIECSNKETNAVPTTFLQKVMDNAKSILSITCNKAATKVANEKPTVLYNRGDSSKCSCLLVEESQKSNNTTDKEVFECQMSYSAINNSKTCTCCACPPKKDNQATSYVTFTASTSKVDNSSKKSCKEMQMDLTSMNLVKPLSKDVAAKSTKMSSCICSTKTNQTDQVDPRKADSVKSISSDKLEYMKTLTDLGMKEKQMKSQIQDLQTREKTYKELLQNFEQRIGTQKNMTCPCVTPSNNNNMIQDELTKISNELKLENKCLKSELIEMKMDLKHCLDRIEGPMQHKLETEKCKCMQLKQELNQASQSMVVNQDTYQREMNSLKMQLCMACSNMQELNSINARLKNELKSLDCMCAKLEDDLVKQKVNEAETLRLLTKRTGGPLDDLFATVPSKPPLKPAVVQERASKEEPFKCDENLHVIARKLSKTLRESAPCEECAKLPAELAGAAKCIKELTDMVISRKTPVEKISGYTQMKDLKDCCCQSLPITGEGACQCDERRDAGAGGGSKRELFVPLVDKLSSQVPDPRTGTSYESAKEQLTSVEQKSSKVSEREVEIVPTDKLSSAPCSVTGGVTEVPCLDKGIPCKTQSYLSGVTTLDSSSKMGPQTMSEVKSDILNDGPSAGMKSNISSHSKMPGKVSYKKSDESKDESKTTTAEEDDYNYTHGTDQIVDPESMEAKELASQKSDQFNFLSTVNNADGTLLKSALVNPKIDDSNFPYELNTKVEILDRPPDGLHVTTVITGSGTLEVITEGPPGLIETTLTFTEDGNIEVFTELTEYKDGESNRTSSKITAKDTHSKCSKTPYDVTSGTESSNVAKQISFEVKTPVDETGEKASMLTGVTVASDLSTTPSIRSKVTPDISSHESEFYPKEILREFEISETKYDDTFDAEGGMVFDRGVKEISRVFEISEVTSLEKPMSGEKSIEKVVETVIIDSGNVLLNDVLIETKKLYPVVTLIESGRDMARDVVSFKSTEIESSEVQPPQEFVHEEEIVPTIDQSSSLAHHIISKKAAEARSMEVTPKTISQPIVKEDSVAAAVSEVSKKASPIKKPSPVISTVEYAKPSTAPSEIASKEAVQKRLSDAVAAPILKEHVRLSGAIEPMISKAASHYSGKDAMEARHSDIVPVPILKKPASLPDAIEPTTSKAAAQHFEEEPATAQAIEPASSKVHKDALSTEPSISVDKTKQIESVTTSSKKALEIEIDVHAKRDSSIIVIDDTIDSQVIEILSSTELKTQKLNEELLRKQLEAAAPTASGHIQLKEYTELKQFSVEAPTQIEFASHTRSPKPATDSLNNLIGAAASITVTESAVEDLIEPVTPKSVSGLEIVEPQEFAKQVEPTTDISQFESEVTIEATAEEWPLQIESLHATEQVEESVIVKVIDPLESQTQKTESKECAAVESLRKQAVERQTKECQCQSPSLKICICCECKKIMGLKTSDAALISSGDIQRKPSSQLKLMSKITEEPEQAEPDTKLPSLPKVADTESKLQVRSLDKVSTRAEIDKELRQHIEDQEAEKFLSARESLTSKEEDLIGEEVEVPEVKPKTSPHSISCSCIQCVCPSRLIKSQQSETKKVEVVEEEIIPQTVTPTYKEPAEVKSLESMPQALSTHSEKTKEDVAAVQDLEQEEAVVSTEKLPPVESIKSVPPRILSFYSEKCTCPECVCPSRLVERRTSQTVEAVKAEEQEEIVPLVRSVREVPVVTSKKSLPKPSAELATCICPEKICPAKLSITKEPSVKSTEKVPPTESKKSFPKEFHSISCTCVDCVCPGKSVASQRSKTKPHEAAERVEDVEKELIRQPVVESKKSLPKEFPHSISCTCVDCVCTGKSVHSQRSKAKPDEVASRVEAAEEELIKQPEVKPLRSFPKDSSHSITCSCVDCVCPGKSVHSQRSKTKPDEVARRVEAAEEELIKHPVVKPLRSFLKDSSHSIKCSCIDCVCPDQSAMSLRSKTKPDETSVPREDVQEELIEQEVITKKSSSEESYHSIKCSCINCVCPGKSLESQKSKTEPGVPVVKDKEVEEGMEQALTQSERSLPKTISTRLGEEMVEPVTQSKESLPKTVPIHLEGEETEEEMEQAIIHSKGSLPKTIPTRLEGEEKKETVTPSKRSLPKTVPGHIEEEEIEEETEQQVTQTKRSLPKTISIHSEAQKSETKKQLSDAKLPQQKEIDQRVQSADKVPIAKSGKGLLKISTHSVKCKCNCPICICPSDKSSKTMQSDVPVKMGDAATGKPSFKSKEKLPKTFSIGTECSCIKCTCPGRSIESQTSRIKKDQSVKGPSQNQLEPEDEAEISVTSQTSEIIRKVSKSKTTEKDVYSQSQMTKMETKQLTDKLMKAIPSQASGDGIVLPKSTSKKTPSLSDNVKKSKSEMSPIASKTKSGPRSYSEAVEQVPSKLPKKKRHPGIDKVKCDCPGICPCVVCSPEVLEMRKKLAARDKRPEIKPTSYKVKCCCGPYERKTYCKCAPSCGICQGQKIDKGHSKDEILLGKVSLTGSKTSREVITPPTRVSNPSNCDCDVCKCGASLIDMVIRGQKPNSKRFLTDHPETCECVDCLCLPRTIEEIAQMKEFPTIHDKKQIYQVHSVKCGCINAINAKKYAERSKIPIPIPSTTGSMRQAKDTTRHPLSCDCAVCKCDPCLDPKKTKLPITSQIACCCADCKCENCPVHALVAALKAQEVPISVVPSTAIGATKSGAISAKSAVSAKDVSGVPSDCCCEVCLCPGTLAKLAKQPEVEPTRSQIPVSPSKNITFQDEVPIDADCVCVQCVCPMTLKKQMLEKPSVQMKPSEHASEHPSVHPSEHPSTHPSEHASTHPSEHPSTHASEHPSTHPSEHPINCTCAQCLCPSREREIKGILTETVSAQGVPKTVSAQGVPQTNLTCACNPCLCDFCPYLQNVAGIPQLPSQQDVQQQAIRMETFIKGEVMACDCVECACDPCADTNMKAPSLHLPCDCTLCDCPECPDKNFVRPGESQPLGQPATQVVPCDCQPECTCDVCADPNVQKGIPQSPVEHPANCDCEVCQCLGDATSQIGENISVAPSAHPEECVCKECVCVNKQKSVRSGVHLPNDELCACVSCLCIDCVLPEGARTKDHKIQDIGMSKTASAITGKESNKNVSILEKVSTYHSALDVIPDQAGDQCPCDDCDCVDCLKKKNLPLHDDTCKCDTCLCGECKKKKGGKVMISQNVSRINAVPSAVPSAKSQQSKAGDECKCDPCLCTDCYTKKRTQKHADDCKCIKCTCEKCLKMISSPEGEPHMDKVALTVSFHDEPHPESCVCKECECNYCVDETKQKSKHRIEGEKEECLISTTESKYCSCLLCACDVCSKKVSKQTLPVVKSGVIQGKESTHSKSCICTVCVCPIEGGDVSAKPSSQHPPQCDCKICQCVPADVDQKASQKISKQVMSKQSVPIQQSKQQVECPCVICTCPPESAAQSRQRVECTCGEICTCPVEPIIDQPIYVPEVLMTSHVDQCTCDICVCANQPKAVESRARPQDARSMEQGPEIMATAPSYKSMQQGPEIIATAPSYKSMQRGPEILATAPSYKSMQRGPEIMSTAPSHQTMQQRSAMMAAASSHQRPDERGENFFETARQDPCMKSDCFICADEKGKMGVTFSHPGAPIQQSRQQLSKISSKEAPFFEIPIAKPCDCSTCECINCTTKGRIAIPRVVSQSPQAFASQQQIQQAIASQQQVQQGIASQQQVQQAIASQQQVQQAIASQQQVIASQQQIQQAIASQQQVQQSFPDVNRAQQIEIQSRTMQQTMSKVVSIREVEVEYAPSSEAMQQAPSKIVSERGEKLHCNCPTCVCDACPADHILRSAKPPMKQALSKIESIREVELAATPDVMKQASSKHVTESRGGKVHCDCPTCKCDDCPADNTPVGVNKARPNAPPDFTRTPGCKCPAGPGGQPGLPKESQTTLVDVREMDNATLQKKIVSNTKENCQCRDEIQEILRTLNKIKCSCKEAELRSVESHGVTKQASEFNETMSGMKMALGHLREKCKAKDKLIKVMTHELSSRSSPSVPSKLYDVLSDNASMVPDYDKASDVASLAKKDSSYKHRHRKDQMKRTTSKHKSRSRSKGKSCTCAKNKGSSGSRGRDGGAKVNLKGFEIMDIRKITDDSIIVKWKPPQTNLVIGYDIFVNGVNQSKVLSGGRTNAMLHGLDLNKTLQLTIYAITKRGRCEPPAIAIYEI